MTLTSPRLARVLISALVALVALAVTVGSSLTQAAHASKPKRVGLIGCSHKLESHPKTYLLACGDGNIGLVSVKWAKFGGPVAHGSGVLVVNECEPNCAAGKARRTNVRITARRPRSINGLRSYSQIRLTRPNGKTAGHYAIDKYGPYQAQP